MKQPIQHTQESVFLDSFAKLWHQLCNLVGKTIPYKRELSLEEKINVILASQKERFMPTDESIKLFCDTVRDSNPLHYDDTYAKTLGFERRLVPGTQIYANLEQFVEDATGILNESLNIDHSLKLSGINVSLPNPLYPRDSIRWQITNYTVDNGKVEIYISGADKNRVIIIPSAKATLSKTLSHASTTEDPNIYRREFSYEILEDSLKNYLSAIGQKSENSVVPWSYLISLAISSLLEISKDADGRPTGINKSMEFGFINRPEIGRLTTAIFLTEEPKFFKRQRLYKYSFGAACYQEDQTMARGTIEAIAEKQLC